MKSTLIILATGLLAALSSTAYAAVNVQPFVGVATGITIDNVGHSDELSGTVQVRGGVNVFDDHRVMLSYSYSDSLKQSTTLASYDYLYSVTPKVKVFAGLSAGVSDSEIDGHSQDESVWGGQTGAIYQFDKDWSLELAYRYLDQDNEYNGEILDATQQLTAAIDFRF